jgi:acyl carrier protein
MSEATNGLSPARLQEILVKDVGIESEAVTEQLDSALVELGLDSLAKVELGVILKARHGVELPEGVDTMTIDELAGEITSDKAA